MATLSVPIIGLAIRLVDREDLPALEWNGEYKHFRNLYQDAFRGMQRGDALMWMADLPNFGLVGQVFVSLNSSRPELADGKNRAYVYGFRVRPQYRKMGIGTHLMQVVEKDLYQRGYRLITLNVARVNHGALRLYNRLGYAISAPEPGNWYYFDEKGARHDVHEPAWRMEKSLG